MLAEALTLFKSAVEGAQSAASKVAILDLPKDPRKFAIVTPDGKIELKDAAPKERKHTLGCVDQVPEFVKFAKETLSGVPSVWYDESAVIVVVRDDETSQRIDQATAPLKYTETFRRVLALSDEWHPQKDFVRLLRITLADAATDSSRLLLRVSRSIGFTQSTAGHGTVELGRQSMGRDIEQQVKSEVGDLPDEIVLNVRIFDDPSLTRRFSIPCAVDVETRNATFNLCPIPGAIDDAVDEQLSLLGQQLENDVECPVFRGRP